MSPATHEEASFPYGVIAVQFTVFRASVPASTGGPSASPGGRGRPAMFEVSGLEEMHRQPSTRSGQPELTAWTRWSPPRAGWWHGGQRELRYMDDRGLRLLPRVAWSNGDGRAMFRVHASARLPAQPIKLIILPRGGHRDPRITGGRPPGVTGSRRSCSAGPGVGFLTTRRVNLKSWRNVRMSSPPWRR
jgi:hypothetical protein